MADSFEEREEGAGLSSKQNDEFDESVEIPEERELEDEEDAIEEGNPSVDSEPAQDTGVTVDSGELGERELDQKDDEEQREHADSEPVTQAASDIAPDETTTSNEEQPTVDGGTILTLPETPMSDQKATKKPSASNALKSLLATKNGKIGAMLAALAIVIIGLFATHTICFHDWSDATCTQPQICQKCGRSKGEALGHDWVDATCTEPKTCGRCGETEGEALGHEVKEWKTVKKATCTSEGKEEGACTRCGEVQSRSIKKKDHEFGDWKVTKKPSCTEEGEETRTCKNCDETESRPIEKTEHTPGDWEIETESTIDGNGGVTAGKRVQKCTVCGQVINEETYEISAEEALDAFMASCASPSYEDVARDPDSYDGTNVAFKGEVIQVLQDGNEYTLRVNVTNTGYYWTDTIMVYYVAQSGDSRILEDDVITFYGTMRGMYSYESVLGATITVPLMKALYIKY